MARLVEERMAAPTSLRRSLRFSPVVWLLGLGACTSVLGIEDLHEGPRPGTAAAGGDANTAGSSTPTAGKSSNSAGSSNSNGGNGTPNGGSNNPNGGSNQVNAGAGNEPSGGAAEGGTGGAPEPVDGPVHGTVIDFWGKPLSNVTVQIGEEAIATDKDGKFTVDPVPAEYDASLTISRQGGDKIYAWYYQGLTRRDPTLQVYQAREDRGTTGYLYTSGATVVGNDTISASLGTPDGSTEKANITTDAVGNYFSPEWQGSASTSGTIHALQWSINQANMLPSAYKTYYSALVALAEGTPLADTTLAMKGPVASDTVTGTVDAAGDHDNSVFVRFSSGASIRLVDEQPTAAGFSYIVPTLANASISVVASQGDSYDAYGLVHKDGLSPGDAAGTLTIPAPATVLSPTSSGTTADQTTQFSFNGSADSKGAYVIHVEATQFYQAFYIVTSKKKFTLPVSNGFDWIDKRVYYWRVETFGALATVDQMAGPTGFADAYYGPTQSTSTGEPQGPKQDSGSFTMSAKGFFTYKCVTGQVCVTP